MNLIEEFRDGAYTLSELSDEYYEGILRKVKVFAERKRQESKNETNEKKFTLDDYVILVEKTPEFDNLSYEEFQELLKLEETVSDKRKRDAVRSITNTALIRRLSLEMTYDDVKLLSGENVNVVDVENENDKYYLALKELGYHGEKMEGVPEIVRGNFVLFRQKETLKRQAKTLVKMKNRFEYYLKHANENEVIEDSFESYQIGYIRKFLGYTKSLQEEMDETKREEFQDYSGIKTQRAVQQRGMKMPNEVDKIVEDLLNDKVEVSKQTYEEFNGWNSGQEILSQTEIVKSGMKLYDDFIMWENIREKCMQRASKVYNQVRQNSRARQYLKDRYGEIQEANPISEGYAFFWRRNVNKRLQKGKEVTQSEQDHLARKERQVELEQKHYLPEKMWREPYDEV